MFYGSIAFVDQGLLFVEVWRSQSDTSQSVGLLWMSDRSVTETSDSTRHSQETDIHAPRAVFEPSKRGAAGPCIIPLGHRHR